MNELDLILGIEKIKITVSKLRFSIDFVKEKNSSRTDIIESMESSVKDLMESLVIFRGLEKEYRSSRELSSNLTIQNLILLRDNEELKSREVNTLDDNDVVVKLEKENELLKKRIEDLISEMSKNYN